MRKSHSYDSVYSYRYIDPTLAAYVGETVTIRYDPRDLAVIRVFYQERFLCQAVCSELAGQTVSLKEIVRARRERRTQVRQGLDERRAVVECYIAIHQPELPVPPPAPTPSRFLCKEEKSTNKQKEKTDAPSPQL